MGVRLNLRVAVSRTVADVHFLDVRLCYKLRITLLQRRNLRNLSIGLPCPFTPISGLYLTFTAQLFATCSTRFNTKILQFFALLCVCVFRAVLIHEKHRLFDTRSVF